MGAVIKEKLVRVVSTIQVSIGVVRELLSSPPGGIDIVFSSCVSTGIVDVSGWKLKLSPSVEMSMLRNASVIFLQYVYSENYNGNTRF